MEQKLFAVMLVLFLIAVLYFLNILSQREAWIKHRWPVRATLSDRENRGQREFGPMTVPTTVADAGANLRRKGGFYDWE
jgi:hypothetical protein